MTRLKRAALLVFGLGAAGMLTLALVLSHNSDCGAPAPLAAGTPTMQAIVYRCYGPPEVLKLEDVAKPVPDENQILVKVHAAAVNPLDWHYMRGEPYVMRLGSGLGAPADPGLGVDYAGTIEAVGSKVQRFKPGDEVFGGRSGALAEYVVARADRAVALKPANMSFEQAASVPVAAVTALQALRDKGQLQAGQRVLINGASGGVGTFAVQIAKSLGAEVTGVCSTRNVDMVRAIGADHVVDYTRQDFTEGGQVFDLIVDNVGNRSISELRRALKPDGTLVVIGGRSDDPWLGPLTQVIKARLWSPFVSQRLLMLMAELNPADLETLRDLMLAGKLTPVIDRSFSLAEVPAAIAYLESGRARGKVVVSLE